MRSAPVERIERKIYFIRDQKVMLDSDLAELYEVQTKILNKAVKRNVDRFPEDFMFRVAPEEIESLRFQIGTSNTSRGGRRYLPYVFSEHGVAMLSSVLNSKRSSADEHRDHSRLHQTARGSRHPQGLGPQNR